MSRHDALRDRLASDPTARATLSFADIGELVGGLPPSVRQYSSWRANAADGRHVQARAWVGVGWKIESVDIAEERATFVRS